MRSKWVTAGTPDGEFLHSVLIDPRDPKHLYIAISIGGIFESIDGGVDWMPLNEGVAAEFLPDPEVPFGHDPHCVALHPLKPDRLYHQNHCGLYRLDRPERRWIRVGRAMPKGIGDIGFPIVLHPIDPDTAWVFPMDGRTVWPRTAIGGKPAVYRTRDAGNTWRRLDRGLPSSQAWFTVLRQSMCTDQRARIGLYFGTTGGDVWEAPMRESAGIALSGTFRRSIRSRTRCRGDGYVNCKVRIASPLRSYTLGAASIMADGATLREILANLEQRFPGIRFRMVDEQDRIRPHMRLFVNTSEAKGLSESVRCRGYDSCDLRIERWVSDGPLARGACPLPAPPVAR